MKDIEQIEKEAIAFMSEEAKEYDSNFENVIEYGRDYVIECMVLFAQQYQSQKLPSDEEIENDLNEVAEEIYKIYRIDYKRVTLGDIKGKLHELSAKWMRYKAVGKLYTREEVISLLVKRERDLCQYPAEDAFHISPLDEWMRDKANNL